MSFKSKLPHVADTIFSVMSALANKHNAINLSQGFPEFDCDEKLIDSVSLYMQKGFNQYAPMPGLSDLREVLATKYTARHKTPINSDNITITSGATQAIFSAISCLVEKGDEVIVFDPAYDCYEPAIAAYGGKTIHIPLNYPDFGIPLDDLAAKITNKTKAIIINSPHNPSGAVISNDELRAIEILVLKHNIYLISDEVYEHIVFGEKQHVSVLDFPALFERSFVCYSFGKTYHTTGWKMGYCIAPPALTKEFRKFHQYIVFSCNTPIQMALAEYVSNQSYQELPAFFQKKRDLLKAALRASRFELLTSNGTYFQLVNYSTISDENDVEFAKRMTIEYGVASIPCSVFYNTAEDHKILRLCFAKNDDTLLKAADILCKI